MGRPRAEGGWPALWVAASCSPWKKHIGEEFYSMGMKAERISTYLNSQKVAKEPLDTPQSPQSLPGAEYQHPQPDPNSLLQL